MVACGRWAPEAVGCEPRRIGSDVSAAAQQTAGDPRLSVRLHSHGLIAVIGALCTCVQDIAIMRPCGLSKSSASL